MLSSPESPGSLRERQLRREARLLWSQKTQINNFDIFMCQIVVQVWTFESFVGESKPKIITFDVVDYQTLVKQVIAFLIENPN